MYVSVHHVVGAGRENEFATRFQSSQVMAMLVETWG